MAQHNLEQKRLLLIQEEIDKAYEENPIQLPFKRLVAIIKAREGSPPNITHKEVRDARSQRYGSEESMGNLYVRSDSEVEGAVSAFLENQARSFDNPLRHPASFLFSAIEKDRPDIFQRLLIKDSERTEKELQYPAHGKRKQKPGKM